MKKKSMAGLIAAAAGFFAFHSLIPAVYYKRWAPGVMRRSGEPGTLMLTFDDGPDERYTGALLDLLADYQVKAVFFVVAREIKGREELIRRMVEEGHMVGFHSLDHQNAMLRGYFHTKKDFELGCRELERAGVKAVCYRPPWGLSNLFTAYFMKKHGMRMVLWDVMAEDWEEKATARSIYEKAAARVKEQSIICLHDGGERSGGAKGAPAKTIKALEALIPELLMEGYRFILPDQGM